MERAKQAAGDVLTTALCALLSAVSASIFPASRRNDGSQDVIFPPLLSGPNL
jgi:hypothetical protein